MYTLVYDGGNVDAEFTVKLDQADVRRRRAPHVAGCWLTVPSSSGCHGESSCPCRFRSCEGEKAAAPATGPQVFLK